MIGVPVSPAQVRGVWQREALMKRFDRLPWLEKQTAATAGPLKGLAKKLLAKHQRGSFDPQSHLEAPALRYLGCRHLVRRYAQGMRADRREKPCRRE